MRGIRAGRERVQFVTACATRGVPVLHYVAKHCIERSRIPARIGVREHIEVRLVYTFDSAGTVAGTPSFGASTCGRVAVVSSDRVPASALGGGRRRAGWISPFGRWRLGTERV